MKGGLTNTFIVSVWKMLLFKPHWLWKLISHFNNYKQNKWTWSREMYLVFVIFFKHRREYFELKWSERSNSACKLENEIITADWMIFSTLMSRYTHKEIYYKAKTMPFFDIYSYKCSFGSASVTWPNSVGLHSVFFNRFHLIQHNDSKSNTQHIW